MITNDQVALDIPQEDLTAIKDALELVKSKLLPHMKKLTAEDRREIPKMGDKTFAFVSKSHGHMLTNPTTVPPYVNVENLKVDLDAVETLKQVFIPLKQVIDMVDDTMLLSGSEAYIGALAYYNYIKGASKAGVPGTQVIYEDLKKRFPGSSKN